MELVDAHSLQLRTTVSWPGFYGLFMYKPITLLWVGVLCETSIGWHYSIGGSERLCRRASEVASDYTEPGPKLIG
jgi:hypothetical protein